MNKKKDKKKIPLNDLLIYFFMGIFTIITIIIIYEFINRDIRTIFSLPNNIDLGDDLLNLKKIFSNIDKPIYQYNMKLVFIIIIFITYILIMLFPTKKLVNQKLKLKKAPDGSKGPRGFRGDGGKMGVCGACSDDLCVIKILYNINNTYNYWRKLRNLELKKPQYKIENKFLIEKIRTICNSSQFKKILTKYGSNSTNCNSLTNGDLRITNCGAYDLLNRLWTTWILIILKYENGYLFLENDSMTENDFNGLITKNDKKHPNISDWRDMFTDKKGLNLTTISPSETKEGGENESINKVFFSNSTPIPDGSLSPFIEIRKYKHWFWGSENEKPNIILKNAVDYGDMCNSCVNHSKCNIYTETEANRNGKLKIKTTRDFFLLWSSEKALQTDDNGILTPNQLYGSQKIYIFRAYEYTNYEDNILFRNYKPLGDIVLTESEVNLETMQPNIEISTVLVSGENTKHPTGYKPILNSYRDRGIDKNLIGFNIWKPNAPPGYKALGYVITTSASNKPPGNNLIYCIKDSSLSDHNNKANYGNDLIWNNDSKDINGKDITLINLYRSALLTSANEDGKHNYYTFKYDSDRVFKIINNNICYTENHPKYNEHKKQCYEHTTEADCNKFSKCRFDDNKCSDNLDTTIENSDNSLNPKYSILRIYD